MSSTRLPAVINSVAIENGKDKINYDELIWR